MQCYNHPESNIVATCNECNKGLCLACTNKYTRPICDTCNVGFAKNSQKVIIRNIILTFFFALFGFCVTATPHTTLVIQLITAYALAGIPWGWSALNRITPSIFLFMPLGHWVVYFIIKLVLSVFAGVIAFPLKIVTTILEWRKLSAIKAAANALDGQPQ